MPARSSGATQCPGSGPGPSQTGSHVCTRRVSGGPVHGPSLRHCRPHMQSLGVRPAPDEGRAGPPVREGVPRRSVTCRPCSMPSRADRTGGQLEERAVLRGSPRRRAVTNAQEWAWATSTTSPPSPLVKAASTPGQHPVGAPSPTSSGRLAGVVRQDRGLTPSVHRSSRPGAAVPGGDAPVAAVVHSCTTGSTRA